MGKGSDVVLCSAIQFNWNEDPGTTAGFYAYTRKVLNAIRLDKIRFTAVCLPDRDEIHGLETGI